MRPDANTWWRPNSFNLLSFYNRLGICKGNCLFHCAPVLFLCIFLFQICFSALKGSMKSSLGFWLVCREFIINLRVVCMMLWLRIRSWVSVLSLSFTSFHNFREDNISIILSVFPIHNWDNKWICCTGLSLRIPGADIWRGNQHGPGTLMFTVNKVIAVMSSTPPFFFCYNLSKVCSIFKNSEYVTSTLLASQVSHFL